MHILHARNINEIRIKHIYFPDFECIYFLFYLSTTKDKVQAAEMCTRKYFCKHSQYNIY